MAARLLPILLGVTFCINVNANYTDPSLGPGQRSQDLLQRLTWEEKIGQMGGIRAAFTSVNGTVRFNRSAFEEIRLKENGQIGYGRQANWAAELLPIMNRLRMEQINSSRLHIPYIIIADSVNGLWFSGGTLFPGTSSMASSWNLPLYEQVIQASRDENMAMGINWVLSPEVDIVKDPRNGRNGEMYGEDSYLVGEFATKYIKTMQEKDERGFYKVATTIKHFVFGTGSGGINRASMAGGLNHILNDLAPPYQKAIKEAQPLSLMASYSAVDGVPMSVNKYLLQNVLQDILGFKGLIMSDANAIELLLNTHKVASSRKDAARKALSAGLKHELKPGGGGLFTELSSMSGDKDVVALVDASVRAFLEIKFATGMFDLPLPTIENMQSTLRNPRHLEINKNITRESIVMLKNDDEFLPRTKSNISATGKIAVVGPYADVINAGNYAPVVLYDPRYGDSFLSSFQKVLGKDNILHAQGTSKILPNYDDDAQQQDEAAIAAAVEKVKEAGLAVVILGSGLGNFMPNTINNDRTDTEGWSHPDLGFPGAQQQLLDAVLDTGVPTILVMSSGQTFPLPNSTFNRCRAIFHSWLAGEYTGSSFVEIFLGETNPSGKLTVTIPEHNGAFPVNYDFLPSDAGGGFGTSLAYDWHWPQLTRKAPLAFGFGLSYTTFSVSSVNVSVSTNAASSNQSVAIQATVSNVGNVSGKEVLQVYFRANYSIIERPVMKLIRFEKLEVDPAEKKIINFDIPIDELGYFVTGDWVVERGNYAFWVGTSSRYEDLRRVELVI
ncbi:glycoside hydrolase family 3 protein [Periconia macrospinosa]|uniref:beta-glucosidase n=1 Tax=Periconia macrospinosa TaxID=97972 RepID=A0A2V1DL62_9PLEO|nr:glycoside hydrolase family 3 protein [Periconia macrospinosa]